MSRITRILVCVATLFALAWVTAGCHTVHGAGQDLESGGKAIQRATD
ncbi:MAG: entericidin A/B family lipoprotein [Phycisphaerales bacterium]|jgi:predicted small secreted protein